MPQSTVPFGTSSSVLLTHVRPSAQTHPLPFLRLQPFSTLKSQSLLSVAGIALVRLPLYYSYFPEDPLSPTQPQIHCRTRCISSPLPTSTWHGTWLLRATVLGPPGRGHVQKNVPRPSCPWIAFCLLGETVLTYFISINRAPSMALWESWGHGA